MTLTLGEIAQLVEGRLDGDGDLPMIGAAILRDAVVGEITLAENSDLAQQLADSSASAVIVSNDYSPESIASITVDDVRAAFAKVVCAFRPQRSLGVEGVHPAAFVSKTAKLGKNIRVGPGATIGDDVVIGDGTTIHSQVCIEAGSQIGENVTLFPGAVLHENTIIGSRSIIHGGAVLGAYGFGYDMVDGRHQLSVQLGYVELASDVEVGACATIDRGTYGPTFIGEGTKIDNHVQIAHNCRIGRHNLLCAKVGIAGSAVTGDFVVMAGQVGVRDHVTIGEGAVLGAQCGVISDVEPGARKIGSPATDGREQWLMQAALGKLPELRKQVKKLVRRVEQLESELIEQTDAKPDAA